MLHLLVTLMLDASPEVLASEDSSGLLVAQIVSRENTTLSATKASYEPTEQIPHGINGLEPLLVSRPRRPGFAYSMKVAEKDRATKERPAQRMAASYGASIARSSPPTEGVIVTGHGLHDMQSRFSSSISLRNRSHSILPQSVKFVFVHKTPSFLLLCAHLRPHQSHALFG